MVTAGPGMSGSYIEILYQNQELYVSVQMLTISIVPWMSRG